MNVPLPLGFFIAHMSGADFFGLVVVGARDRLPLLRLIRGEKL